MTDAIRNAFRGRQGRYEYNALGESLISEEEGENTQGNENVSVTNASEGFGIGDALEPDNRNSLSDFGRSIRQRFQNLMGTGPEDSREQAQPAAQSSRPARTSGEMRRTSGESRQVDVALQRHRQEMQNEQRQQQRQQSLDEMIQNCKNVIEGARVSSSLLQETVTNAAQNPQEMASMAEALGDLAAVCRGQQDELNTVLTAPDSALYSHEATLMAALEVNEKLAMALQLFQSLAGETPALQQQEAARTPEPEAPAVAVAHQPEQMPQEMSEEEMLAIAMAESLKSEEERKEREQQDTLQQIQQSMSTTPIPTPPPPAPPANLLDLELPPPPPAYDAPAPNPIPQGTALPPPPALPVAAHHYPATNPFAPPPQASAQSPPPSSLMDLDAMLPPPPPPPQNLPPLQSSSVVTQPEVSSRASASAELDELPVSCPAENKNSLLDM